MSAFYVAAISAILSIPFVIAQEFIFSRYLDAPDENDQSTDAIISAQVHDVTGAFKLEYATLLTELDRFRSSLDDDSKASLDEMWSKASPMRPLVAIRKDLADVNRSVRINRNALHNMASRSQSNRANALLLCLFQHDLMPYSASLAVTAKQRREFDERPQPVAQWKKQCGWLCIYISNVGALIYILLFSLRQDGSAQSNWLKSLLWWLFFDIFIFSTLSTYIADVYIPSLFYLDVKRASDTFSAALSSQLPNTRTAFNACKYLFASHKIAQAFPDLSASKVVLGYSSPWPRRSYKSSLSLRGALATSILMFFKVIIDLSPSMQDEVCKALLRVATINGLIIANSFGLADTVSVVIALLIAIGIFYIIHIFLTVMVYAKKTDDSVQKALVSTAVEASSVPDTYQRDSTSVVNRRTSLVLGIEAVIAIQKQMDSDAGDPKAHDDSKSEDRFSSSECSNSSFSDDTDGSFSSSTSSKYEEDILQSMSSASSLSISSDDHGHDTASSQSSDSLNSD
jgi:hypothetical protein